MEGRRESQKARSQVACYTQQHTRDLVSKKVKGKDKNLKLFTNLHTHTLPQPPAQPPHNFGLNDRKDSGHYSVRTKTKTKHHKLSYF